MVALLTLHILPLLALLGLQEAAAASGAGERHVLRWVDAASGLSSELPHARAGSSISHFEYGTYDIIFLFGGCGEVGCFDDLKRYDQKKNRWTSPAFTGKPPSKRKGHTMALLGEEERRLFVWGGWAGDGPVSPSLKAFNVASARWEVPSTAGTPPAARWAHSATAVDSSRLLVFGGEGVLPGQYFNDLYLFDAKNEMWSPLHPKPDGSNGRTLPEPRMGHSACLIDGAVYVFGGYGQERRGSRVHRTARNDLWALDLKPGVTTPQWMYVETIGHAPTARGFHAALASSQGGNMFILGGCDEVEAVCMNDLHMLDTEYPDGMRWRQLPVGMQRYEPRQHFAAWVSGARIVLQGGCAPALAAVGTDEHCFSDMWALDLGDLLRTGAKSFNISADGTMLTSPQLAAGAPLRAPRAAQLPPPQRGASNGVSLGELPPNATAPPNGTALVDEDEGAPMEHISTAAALEERCSAADLSGCERTTLAAGVGALSLSLAVGDTSALALGRFVRINPGGLNQEDAKIVGFGRPLTPEEAETLQLMAKRDAAENAKESVEGRSSFLQLRERASALLPPSRLTSRRAAVELVQSPPHHLLSAAERARGHAPQRHLNLSAATKFAHAAGELVLQLPLGTHKPAPAPGLMHLLRPFSANADPPPAASPPPAAAPRLARASRVMARPPDDWTGEEAEEERAPLLQGQVQLIARVSQAVGYPAAAPPPWLAPLVGLSAAAAAAVGLWLLLRIRSRLRAKDVELEDVRTATAVRAETWRKGR
ncbi:hypothetical protein AB1Y20_014249 [Prymnesium parvum]|uniref:Uncharacterized protein n=1 Tax=Prymnesium parvum TaxID=97485 RepID=A0AB34IF67_PRYPA